MDSQLYSFPFFTLIDKFYNSPYYLFLSCLHLLDKYWYLSFFFFTFIMKNFCMYQKYPSLSIDSLKHKIVTLYKCLI